jgi:hypothetical protein
MHSNVPLTTEKKIGFYNTVPTALLKEPEKKGGNGGNGDDTDSGGGMMHWVMGGDSVSENSVKMMLQVDAKSVRHPDKDGML